MQHLCTYFLTAGTFVGSLVWEEQWVGTYRRLMAEAIYQSAQNFKNILIIYMFESFILSLWFQLPKQSFGLNVVSHVSTCRERMGMTGLHDCKMTVFFKVNKQTFCFISLLGAWSHRSRDFLLWEKSTLGLQTKSTAQLKKKIKQKNKKTQTCCMEMLLRSSQPATLSNLESVVQGFLQYFSTRSLAEFPQLVKIQL